MIFAPKPCAALVLVGLALASTGAQAQNVRLLGDFRDWSSYATTEGSGALCFALSKPKTVDPTPDGYSQAYLYVTHRPAENITNEVNLVAGFTFAPDSPATLSVGSQAFQLFTENDAAWLQDPGQSDALASAIRAGSTLVVEATTDKGIRVTETFSLSGATAASRAIDTGC
ncbi:hypothetical protein XM25_16500 [Devosia sp. H5989]|uniref:Invasion associated locus B family protein n=1 Tax=Paradevosia tibetensis TaxID=1447062 RepID=A0A5B9DVA9_9HYPH|nr:invasion associated locus B family protein [Youhaiella tibetensis]AKR57351.1 hypothetical protein XM25_16500 [Devosia sp. H5989]QEE22284.1 hypothetical protein FNA67_19900 [Youhaiella tibetensis]